MKAFLFVLLCLISLSMFTPSSEAACPNQAQQFQLVPVKQRAAAPVNNSAAQNNINIVNDRGFGFFGRRQRQVISINQNPGGLQQPAANNINVINGRRR